MAELLFKRPTKVKIKRKYLEYGDDIQMIDENMVSHGYQLIDNLYTNNNTDAKTYLNNHVYIEFETKKGSTDIILVIILTAKPEWKKRGIDYGEHEIEKINSGGGG